MEGVFQVPLLRFLCPFSATKLEAYAGKMGPNLFLAKLRNDVRIFSTPSLTVIHGGKGTENNSASDRNRIEIGDTRYVGLPTYNYGNAVLQISKR